MATAEANPLFPVFLQLNNLQTLVVGGGDIALEKLTAVLANSPDATITIIATQVSKELGMFVKNYARITIFERPFVATDLDEVDIAIIATNNNELNSYIRTEARRRRVLLNVADKPALCDFYLGSIVQKGNLKVGISTNGKSPTIAKRLKEVLKDALPEELDETLTYMSLLRERLKGDFTEKVKQLNAHTAALLETKDSENE